MKKALVTDEHSLDELLKQYCFGSEDLGLAILFYQKMELKQQNPALIQRVQRSMFQYGTRIIPPNQYHRIRYEPSKCGISHNQDNVGTDLKVVRCGDSCKY